MTPEQLLQPRYEVTASYPNTDFYVGDIIEEGFNGFCKKVRSPKGGSAFYNMVMFEKHPNIFRKLEWWEKRDIKDMPEYVKTNKEWSKLSIQKVNGFYGSDKEFITLEGDMSNKYQLFTEWFIPSTEEEYNKQKNRKN